MKFCEYDEAEDLAEMAKEIWTEYYSTFPDRSLPDYVVKRFQSEMAIKQQMHDGFVYCYITENDAKAGYFCLLIEGDSLFLSRLFLLKDFRGRGLGSGAIDMILEWAKKTKMKRVYLRVYRQNTSALDIYTHKGFKIIEERREDIGDGFHLDDLIMEYVF